VTPMATVARKFGTDISNLSHIPVPITAKKVPQKPFHSLLPLTAIQLQEAELLGDVPVAESIVPSAVDSNDVSKTVLRYEKDFLLSFRTICVEPIEGLLPEICKDYAGPQRVPLTLTSRFFHKKIFVPKKTKEEEKIETPATASNLEEVSIAKEVAELVLSEEPTKMESVPEAPSQPTVVAVAVPTKEIKLEWRAKPQKPKKVKPRETDAKRLGARQKQLNIGMNTPGFKIMMSLKESERTHGFMRSPDIHQVCSKRSWDGQVKKWRRFLHLYDPQGIELTLDTEEVDEESEDVNEPTLNEDCLKSN